VNLYGFVGNDGVNRLDLLGAVSVWTVKKEMYGEKNWPENGNYVRGVGSIMSEAKRLIGDSVWDYVPKWLLPLTQEGGNWHASAYVDWKTTKNNGLRIGWGVNSSLNPSLSKVMNDVIGFKATKQGESFWTCDSSTGIWVPGDSGTYGGEYNNTLSGPVSVSLDINGIGNYRAEKVSYLTVKLEWSTKIDLGGSVSPGGVGIGNLLRKEHSDTWQKTFECRCTSGSGRSGHSDSDGNYDGADE